MEAGMTTMLTSSDVILFKDRLDVLACPYTAELDEDSILSILTCPGETRFKILHWLFCRYDPELEDFLDSSIHFSIARNESRVQKLLQAANALCLCNMSDEDLVKGEASVKNQVEFFNRFLELITCKEEQFGKSSMDGSHKLYHSHLNILVSLEGFHQMFDAQLNLLPRDIAMEVESFKSKQDINDKSVSPVSMLESLILQSESLKEELHTHQLQLSALQKEIRVQEANKDQEVLIMSSVLSTLVKDLRQLAEGFSQCFQSSISQWCNTTPPQLSQLGVHIEQVHQALQSFTQLLSQINEINEKQTKLQKMVKKEFVDGPVSLGDSSKNLCESFQQCLVILEETLHRYDVKFTSKYPSTFCV